MSASPWQVRPYRQHPKAAPVWLLHDGRSHAESQVATFLDYEEARAVAAVLNAGDDAYRTTLRDTPEPF